MAAGPGWTAHIPLFHQGSSSAGSEPEPSFKTGSLFFDTQNTSSEPGKAVCK